MAAASSYEKAIELLSQMCAESEGMPDHAEVHLWLGRCRMQLGQYPEAVKELTASIHLDPTDPVAFRNRAQAYRILNENERAELDQKRAEELEKKGRRRRGEGGNRAQFIRIARITSSGLQAWSLAASVNLVLRAYMPGTTI